MKKMIRFIFALLVVLSMSLPVYAAEGKVSYEGKAEQFVFEPGSEYSPTDLFPEFKDVMPGDVLTQKITVRNNASKKVKVKIYMRSLGAEEGSEAFLEQLNLKVQKSEDNEAAYMFDANADQTAQLTDWVYLGTLYSGGEVNLDVILEVPVELDGAFQNQIGFLSWEFMVKEYPKENSDPQAPPTEKPSEKPNEQAPGTGDMNNPEQWFGFMAGAFLVLVGLVVWRKKRERTAE